MRKVHSDCHAQKVRIQIEVALDLCLYACWINDDKWFTLLHRDVCGQACSSLNLLQIYMKQQIFPLSPIWLRCPGSRTMETPTLSASPKAFHLKLLCLVHLVSHERSFHRWPFSHNDRNHNLRKVQLFKRARRKNYEVIAQSKIMIFQSTFSEFLSGHTTFSEFSLHGVIH